MQDNNRENLTLHKIKRLFDIFLKPKKSTPFLTFHAFTDISPQDLAQKGIKYVILDIDGTLTPHHSTRFSPEIIQKLKEFMDSGLSLCIYSNFAADRYEKLAALNIPVATNLPAKPDPKGFQTVLKKYFQNADPKECVMIGDNPVTDGGCVNIGIKYIDVNPLNPEDNKEKFLQKTIRNWTAWWITH